MRVIKVGFIVVCLLLAIDFLNNIGYAYRDLKPENILIGRNGYIKVSDLKLMRDISSENFFDTSGTTGYIAPEIIFNQNHGCASDIFSLGVVAYELMIGKLPYDSNSRYSYKQHILKEMVVIRESDIAEGWSEESADFINRCIYRRPISRIGYNSIEEIKDHKWFLEIDWAKIQKLEETSNIAPSRGNNFSPRSKVNDYYKYISSENLSNLQLHMEYLECQGTFDGYFYDDLYKEYVKKNQDINLEDPENKKDFHKFIRKQMTSLEQGNQEEAEESEEAQEEEEEESDRSKDSYEREETERNRLDRGEMYI